MKSKVKARIASTLGVTAIIAVIFALSLTACDNGSSPTDNAKQTTTATDKDGTPIPAAEIVIEAPVKDEAPATTATVEADTFTAGAVTWSPADNPFKGGVAYTATVTLTAKNGYNFVKTTAATVNGQAATVSDNTGAAVKVSHAFPATKLVSVTEITIKTPPTKLSYTQGDTLDLAGLVITLKYDDGTSEDIAAANFAANNITAIPSQGNDLTIALHNGKPVSVSYGSKHSINTTNLTVTMNFAIDAIEEQTYTGSAFTPALVVKDGTKTLTLTTDYTVAYSGNTNAGEATVSVSGAGTYAGSTGTATFTINKATPVADDYTISGNFSPASAAAAITVTAKTGKSDGAVSVKYAGSTTLPTKGGIYAVTFDVAGTANWNAASGLSAGTLNIAFTSVDDFGTWLTAQPTNTIATAYPVRLNVNNLNNIIRNRLNGNANKYVNLDCSGSTFTSVSDTPFYGSSDPHGCATLTGMILPNTVTSINASAFQSCANLASVTIPNIRETARFT